MANTPDTGARLQEEKLPRGDRFLGALCYLNILILIPAVSARRREKFVSFALNQGVVLLAMATVSGAIGALPYCGEVSATLVLLVDTLSLVALVQALRGICQPLPFVSTITKNFHPFS